MTTDLDDGSAEFEWVDGCGIDFSADSLGYYWSTFMTPVGFGLDGPFGPFESRDEAREDAKKRIAERAEVYDQDKVISGEQSFDD